MSKIEIDFEIEEFVEDFLYNNFGYEENVLINELVSIAREENDYATENMLQWFVSEQVEEEETAQGMIDALKLIGDNGFGVYTMDKELSQRKYTPIGTGSPSSAGV